MTTQDKIATIFGIGLNLAVAATLLFAATNIIA